MYNKSKLSGWANSLHVWVDKERRERDMKSAILWKKKSAFLEKFTLL